MTFDFQRSPPVFRLDGFAICGDVWEIEGLPFIDSDILWSMYYPERQRWMGFSQEEQVNSAWWFERGRPFFAAQLRYRGIDCPAWVTCGTAAMILKDALDFGLGVHKADLIRETEESMRRLYKPVFEEWQARASAARAMQLPSAMPLTPESIRTKHEVISISGDERSCKESDSEDEEVRGQGLSASKRPWAMQSPCSTETSEIETERELGSGSGHIIESVISSLDTSADVDETSWRMVPIPGEKARANVTRFLICYYFTGGEIDRSKTPEPLVLRGFSDILALDEEIIRLEIDGLETAFAGDDGANSVCIGWGRDSVQRFAESLRLPYAVRRHSPKQPQKHTGSLMNQLMPLHTMYVSEVARARRKTCPTGGRDSEFAGQYVVRCDKAAKWMTFRKMSPWDAIRLSIYDGSDGGEPHLTYHLGPFGGAFQVRPAAQDRNGSVLETRADEEGDGNKRQRWLVNRGKRKLSSSLLPAGSPAKQARPSSDGLRFTLYGSCPDQIPPGYLEFADSECLTFKGAMFIHSIGEQLHIEGYKTGGLS